MQYEALKNKAAIFYAPPTMCNDHKYDSVFCSQMTLCILLSFCN
jgi:hypothetical protein